MVEMIVLKNMVSKENFEMDDHCFKSISPNFYKLLQTALTIPISSTLCER